MTLKLTARIRATNPRHATIDVFQNGGNAGKLVVDKEHADELVALLNAATEMLKVCKGLEAVTFLVTEMLNAHNLACPSALRFLTEQARAALAKAKGTTRCPATGNDAKTRRA